ncbi:MAG: hypothetical protein E6J66_19860 [Deltaproteobacteria bacterium]|nr:MAG: hypothetical protein E6J66_19860 [Deltaproteobacteria bacterium]
MKKTKCPRCGKTAFEPATYAARRDLDGRRFTGDVPARKCTSCGELLISGVALGEQPQAARTASGRLGLRPALEQGEGKAATRAVLEALATRKKVSRSVRLDVNAAR